MPSRLPFDVRHIAVVPLVLAFIGTAAATPFALSLAEGQRFHSNTSVSYSVTSSMAPTVIDGHFDLVVTKRVGSRFVLETSGVVGSKPFAKRTVEFDPTTLEQFLDGKRQKRSLLAFFFDPAVWGTPSSSIYPGAKWKAPLREPWDYGPPGDQDVTVISVDKENGSVTLERRGEGSGSSEPELERQNRMTMSVQGRTHDVQLTYLRTRWTGRSTIRAGVVVSSHLHVEQQYSVPAIDVLPPQQATSRTDISTSTSP